MAQAIFDRNQEEKLKKEILDIDQRLGEKENLHVQQVPQVLQESGRIKLDNAEPMAPVASMQTKAAALSFEKPQPQPAPMSLVDKKIEKSKMQSEVWLTISKLAFEQDYQQAYELALTNHQEGAWPNQ